MDGDEVAEFDSQVVASDFVHLNATLLDVVGAQADEDSVASLLATEIRMSANATIRKTWRTYRTMMVSPLNNCKISIVAGLRVATNNAQHEHAIHFLD